MLGASQFDGRPSAVFKARLDHAKALYDAGVAPASSRSAEVRRATASPRRRPARTTSRGKGVAAVVAVGVGRDTLQSLRASRSKFDGGQGWKTAVLVTDPWHSLRSRRMATDLGITVHTSPTRSGPANASRGDRAAVRRAGDCCLPVLPAVPPQQRGRTPGRLTPAAA